MGASEQLAALRVVYDEYAAAYAQRVIDNGPLHGLHKFLLGNSTAGDRKADTGFYNAVERAVDGLRLSLTGEEDGTAEAAVRLMILESEGSDPTSGLMIEAAQALAIPLIPHLTPAARGEITAAYKRRYPKKRMLSPRQRELLAALESE